MSDIFVSYARDHRVELTLADGEWAGDRGPHRNLHGDDDAAVRGLDDPAEPTQRDDAIAGRFGILGTVDRAEDPPEDIADGLVIPRRGLAMRSGDGFGYRKIASLEDDFDIERHRTA